MRKTSKQTTKYINAWLWLKTHQQKAGNGGGEWAQAWGPPWRLAVHLFVFCPCVWAPARSFSQRERRGSGWTASGHHASTISSALRDPRRSMRFFFPLCLSPLPPTRIYFCQLPYSCLQSAFARTHETFLVRATRRCCRLWAPLVRW